MDFAKRLRHWSEEFNCSILLDYVNQLENYIFNFDGENLITTVQQFPEIRRSLEKSLS